MAIHGRFYSYSFDPSLVTITRHRQSVTQQEVSVAYAGRTLGRYGDDMRLAGREWTGRSDAEWVSLALRVMAEG